MSITLRPLCPEDYPDTADLFTRTIFSVNCADYTPAQLAAWVFAAQDSDRWAASFSGAIAFAAEEDGVLCGFGDARPGLIDRLYVAKEHLRRGVGSLLLAHLERSLPAGPLFVHASITARPFFEARGYRVTQEQTVVRCGIELKNFVMTKERAAH